MKLAKEVRDQDNVVVVEEPILGRTNIARNTRSPSKENISSSPVLRVPKRAKQPKEVVAEPVDLLKAWKKKWDVRLLLFTADGK